MTFTRRKPLESHVALRRIRPLDGHGTLQRHKPLKGRSAKTTRIYVARRDLVAYMLEEHPWCQIRWDRKCQRRSVDVHEPGMRSRGADILNPAECITGCRYCHDQVHRNPALATARGFMIPSGDGAGDAA